MNRAEKMLDLLDGGKNWTKGKLEKDGKVCLMGANLSVRSENISYNQARDIMDQVVTEQYPDRIYGQLDLIPNFNDHPDTNWDDIRAVLEKVSTKLDEVV